MNELIKNKKILLFIVTLQEAFTAVVPFFLLTAFVTLLLSFAIYFNSDIFFISPKALLYLSKTLQSFTSIVAVISISYFFALRIKTSQIISIILSVCVFVTLTLIENSSVYIFKVNDYTSIIKLIDDISIPLILPYGFTPATLISPILSTYLLKYFYPKLTLNISAMDGNYHIYKLFNYLFVFFVAYFVAIILYVFVNFFMNIFFHEFNPLEMNIPDVLILIIRDFMVQVLWFIGIHGSHTVNGLFGKAILFKEVCPNLTYGEFNRMFVLIGGAGIGLGMLISFWIFIKDRALRYITKISTPFVFFNINTLLIYSIIVLNRFFLIPFIFLPLLNIIIAYIFLHIVHIDFTHYYVSWTTPVFIDSYLKTNGNILVILLQVFLVIIDTLVYMYFTKKFVTSNSYSSHIDILEKNLEIPVEIKSKEGIYAFKAHKELIAAQAKLDEVINSLNKDTLKIYYQPQIDITNNSCNKFEALIRHSINGKITGPEFLPIIEEAGLAPIIDIWACKEVKKHLNLWEKEGFNPQISINLHPDTLKSKDAINKIIDILYEKNIMFEIIERSFLYGKIAENNVYRLQNNGFKIAIDDYGIGYSSLEIITKLKIDELKIDKSLIDIINTEKGFAVCKHTVNLCHDLYYKVVAEGVETKEQYEKVKLINIDYVQGYYFSPALPFNRVHTFYTEFNKHI
ncbi:cyclic diguanylate phosphodiesterase (EAL) domain protein [Nautilia profundicola AmH]|uniref:Cyclic diguanylate phosphodiesterase (EAL) domain protein n=1 Tax=Nautilia profundicola (strain ATCC BAA-1463 / DSM 18972 / AmH) TaxID=598659 RepID=B9L7D8_NAUPA|nr:EAL domain-containing protein [Nautilia profundicola]ACM93754.1 cyclic diguanylate phosphodiesterase (EAL) domain protein [Nautilia profundicola AmH]